MGWADLTAEVADEFELLGGRETMETLLEQKAAYQRARWAASARERYRKKSWEQKRRMFAKQRMRLRRQRLRGRAPIRCENDRCRAEFVPVSAKTRFCTNACRWRAQMRRLRAEWRERRPRVMPASCQVCSAGLRAQRVTKMYCSHRCANRAHVARQRARRKAA